MTDGATPGSLPRAWYTEEMFQAAERGYRQCNDWVEEPLRAALDAIAPMVEKLLKEQYGAGHLLGYANGAAVATHSTPPAKACVNCESETFTCAGCGVVMDALA